MSERENEQKSQFPFNGYDIFGYIIPGGMFFLAIYIFDYWAKTSMNFKHNPVLTLVGLFRPMHNNSQLNTFDSIAFVLAVILVIYVIGHIIAALSSFFIDRLLIKKGHHYPIKSILLKEPKNSEGAQSIKGIFILFNVSLGLFHLLSCTYLAFSYSVHAQNNIIWHIVLLVALLSVFISFLFMFSYNYLLNPLKPFTWIYNFFSKRLREIVGSEGGISKEVRKNYKKFLQSELKFKKDNLTTDIYWLSFIYISRKSPSAVKLLSNWMHLYSFSRNLASGFYVAFIYCTLSVSINSHLISDTNYQNVYKFKIMVGSFIPVAYWLISILFLLRFYYLYHGYYSKFIIRTCAFLYQQSKGIKDSD